MTSVYLGDFCKDYLQIRSTSKAVGVKTSMYGTGGGERVQFIMVHVLLLWSEVKWKSPSHVQLFATLWTTQFMEFSRPEYWSG